MLRSLPYLAWSRLAPLALLSGCLVTFNDYPAGSLSFDAATGGTDALAGSAPTGGGTNAAGTGAAPSNGGSAPSGGTDVAGSGGSAGTTGDTNGGSSPEASGGAPADVDPNMIDDFEDGDAQILEQQGRSGAWFVQNDGSGTQTPDPSAATLPSDFQLVRSGSRRGMHTSGGPFDTWGALIGTSLATVGGEAAPYDLSSYQGLKVWVRSSATAPQAAKEVRLNVVTPAASRGGSCGNTCDYLSAVIPLTSKWTQVDVPFSMLKPQAPGAGPGWHNGATPTDLSQVTSLQFSFPAGVSFDLWLDDITLY